MDSSRIKPALKKSLLHRNCTPTARSLSVEEKDILEAISLGASLSDILNALCDAIDVQIGNIISLAVLSGAEEYDLPVVGQSRRECGLYIFCWVAILSDTDDLLGTLKIYCCDPRTPTTDEFQIIERVTHLAALAIQSQNGEDDRVTFVRGRNSGLGRRSPGKISFTN
jgi:hypothetical protein